MARYEKEFKEQIVKKMMPPNAVSVAWLSRETGVSTASLFHWRNEYRHQGIAVPADSSNPEQWSGENKLAVVIESAKFYGEELNAYCRGKGFYPEQVERWKNAAILGNEKQLPPDSANKKLILWERKKNKDLERELRRKEKALAETAALLVLQKKARAIWGAPEED